MKGFYIIFQLIIISLLILNPILFIFFGDFVINLPPKEQYSLIAIFILLEFFIINILVKIIFQNPITNLELTIKKFITGRYKDDKIIFKKGINSNLNYIISFFDKTLNTLKNIKDEFIHGKEIKGEVQLGKEIQGKMLEKKLPKVPSLDIIMKSKSSGEIGGDSYDIIAQDDNYYIYVGDATGHGVGAGFIMIMVNALVSGFSKIFKSGATILGKTNEILKPRVKANLLMTLLLVRWDEKAKKIYMTGAGHEYLMIYKHKENKTYKIKSGGVALGMIRDISKLLKEKEIKFEMHDIIILYSDGITEAINRSKKDGNEEMFGEQRLIEAINNAPVSFNGTNKSANSVFNNITIELSKFMGYKHCQLDDVTLGVVHYTGEESETNEYRKINNDFITEWNWRD